MPFFCDTARDKANSQKKMRYFMVGVFKNVLKLMENSWTEFEKFTAISQAFPTLICNILQHICHQLTTSAIKCITDKD